MKNMKPSWLEEAEKDEAATERNAAEAAKAENDAKRRAWDEVINGLNLVYHVGDCIRSAEGRAPTILEAARIVNEGELPPEGVKYLASRCENGGWKAAVEAVEAEKRERIETRLAEIHRWIASNNPPKSICEEALRRGEGNSNLTAESIIKDVVAEYNSNIKWRRVFGRTRKEVLEYLNHKFGGGVRLPNEPEMGMPVTDGYSSARLVLDENGGLSISDRRSFAGQKYSAWGC